MTRKLSDPLDRMLPPDPGQSPEAYRSYATKFLMRLSDRQFERLCRFFQTNARSLLACVMYYQFHQAGRLAEITRPAEDSHDPPSK
jgi:hypothetical protein